MIKITNTMKIKDTFIFVLALLFGFMALSGLNRAQAHQFSTAYLAIETHDNTPITTAEYRLAVRDLSLLVPVVVNENNQITWGAIKAQDAAISALLAQNLHWKSGAAVCTMNSQREPLAIDQVAGLAYIVAYVSIDCGKSKATTLDYRMLGHIDTGHRLIVSSQDADKPEAVGRTWLIAPSVTELGNSSSNLSETFMTYVKEGTHHILTGYDHLLFLFCLLLPAVYRRVDNQWVPVESKTTAIRNTFYIATAFTLAHSITLTVAALNIVSLPSRWVESAIAFSIAVAALNNIFPSLLGAKQIRIAFIFGLIHGFGFASALSDLPLQTSARLMALFSFNFGIELGQLTCILIFFPLALAFRSMVFYRQVMFKGGSIIACVLALLWMTQRILDLNWIPG
jgi:hypothetical protein